MEPCGDGEEARGLPGGVGAARRGGRSGCCARCWRHLCGTTFCSVGICIIIVAYMVAGALLFSHVEGGAELAQRRRAERARQALHSSVVEARRQAVECLWNITFTLNVLHKSNWMNLTSQQLQLFQTELLAAAAENVTSTPPPRWGFAGSFLYSLTVITTIGYGACSPQTDAGKMLTIGYAVLGIPLMLLYLSNIGDILARCLKYVCGTCCCCRSSQYKTNSIPLDAYRPPAPPPPTQLNHVDGDLKHHHHHHHHHHPHHQLLVAPVPADVVPPPTPLPAPGAAASPLPFCLCLVCMLAYLLAGGYLLTVWEDWSYLDGAYFCFVSLSTIGFGELTPGSGGGGGGGAEAAEAARSQLAAALYLLLGMALIAMCFNLMQEQAVSLMRWLARRAGAFGDVDESAAALAR